MKTSKFLWPAALAAAVGCQGQPDSAPPAVDPVAVNEPAETDNDNAGQMLVSLNVPNMH